MLSQSQGCFDFPFALTFQSKRHLTFIGFAVRRFITGINYAIVTPTLWFYLESFGAPYYFLGLGIAADSLVGIFVSPFVGKISDKTRHIRMIGFLTIFADFVGNMVYALPLHVYMPILGRCISGLGGGYTSALYGEVARVTTIEERTRIVTIIEGARLVGITIGPSFNLFLQYLNFSIGPWTIDKVTAPGFFMSILWLIVGVIHFFTVYNLTKDYKEYEKEFCKENVEDKHSDDLNDHAPINENNAEVAHEAYQKFPSSDNEDGDTEADGLTYYDILKSQNQDGTRKSSQKSKSFFRAIQEIFLRSELVVLFLTTFLMYFNQSSFESLAPLIGVEMLDFSITYLSILYLLAGVELVIVIVLVWMVSHYMSDRNLLLSSVAMGAIGVFAQIGVALTEPHTTGCLVMGALMSFFILLAIPITTTVGKSLLSKITAHEEQGFYQGLLTSTQQLGLIVGPLVGSALFSYLSYFSISTFLILCATYLLTLSAMDKLI